MIKKLKEYFGLLLIILGVLSIFYPAVYWSINDDLTKMQVFKDVWYILPLSVFFISIRKLFSRHRPFINFIRCCGAVLMHYNA